MAKGILDIIYHTISCFSLGLFIASLVFLFKIKKNAKNEPIKRGQYIQNDPLNYYLEEDFCYKHYEPYSVVGAFKDFDLHFKQINKFSIILIIIFFIKLFFLILINITGLPNKKYACSSCISILLYFINEICLLIFFIIISVHYFKCNFKGFDKFYNCLYLSYKFKNDYSFVFDVKTKFITFFILTIIFISLNCIQICLAIAIIKD